MERRVRKSRWDWLTTTITGLDGEFDLVTVPAKLPMAEVYAGVTFPDPPPHPPAGRPR